MKRLEAMMRDTWFLWVACFIAATLMAVLVSPIFVAMYPLCAIACAYFMFMRYDAEGNPKEDG